MNLPKIHMSAIHIPDVTAGIHNLEKAAEEYLAGRLRTDPKLSREAAVQDAVAAGDSLINIAFAHAPALIPIVEMLANGVIAANAGTCYDRVIKLLGVPAN